MTLHARPEPLPRAAGWAVFGVFAVFLASGVVRTGLDDPGRAAIGGVIAFAGAAVATFGPPRLVVPAVAIASGGVIVVCQGEPSNVGWFAIPTLAGWCAMATPVLTVLVYWLGAVLLFLGELVFVSRDAGWAAWIGGTSFAVVGCYFGRRQRDLVAQLREAQAGLALRAQAEERNRIARELHDVIAHSLTVSLLHVSSARLALDEDPHEAAAALEEAERLGRQSLDEVRHAVGLLRRDGQHDPTAPLPGSLDVPALVERFRAAGAEVSAHLEGDLAALPSTVGLAAYRIVQEALTNAAKHAPRAPAHVELRVEPEAVRLCVDSAGPPQQGNGLGLVGMRERAESLGGHCEAGPGGSGWLVRAELPL
jgi:signal transduction histidine kinase